MAFCKHRVMDKCKKDNMPCIYSKECCEPEEKKITNADAIRNMTDEELAEFLKNFWNKTLCDYCTKFIEDRPCNHECEKGFLEWLQAEVKEGAEDE